MLLGIAEGIEASELTFDVGAQPAGKGPVASLARKLAEIDFDGLGEDERDELLSVMSKLLSD